MAIYTLTISVGMLGGIFLSTALFSALGAPGLDLYFGGIAGGLVLLTALRYRDLRRGDSGRPVDPGSVRTPVR